MPPTRQRTDPDCEFCEIVGREAGAREVFRNEVAIAIFPLDPAVIGHTLLLPLEHVQDIWHLEPELAAGLAVQVVYLANVMRRSLRPEGLNVIQSNGDAATQAVMHLHIHLVPRWTGDRIGEIWPADKRWPAVEVDSALAAMRKEWRMETLRGQGGPN